MDYRAIHNFKNLKKFLDKRKKINKKDVKYI